MSGSRPASGGRGDKQAVAVLEEPDSADALQPPHAHGEPVLRGVLRAEPEHFVVEEIPLAPPDEEGDHAWLEVRKRGANTQWVASALARHAGVPLVDVGFAGLKDRNAVTTQWFSVSLAGRADPDWSDLAEPGVEVLRVSRARRKLRRGELAGNRFGLRVTSLHGEFDALAERVARVGETGVPNYFGPQRFGHGGGNLVHARAMFERRERVRDRHRRGLYLSAARSLLFNRVLASRVRLAAWTRALPGDLLLYDDGGTSRVGEAVDERQARALAVLQCHPSGPLWGRGRQGVDGEALAIESEALAGLAGWRNALEHAGLSQERRALRLVVADLHWQLDAAAGALEVGFSLPAGAYATVVLRELIEEVGAAP